MMNDVLIGLAAVAVGDADAAALYLQQSYGFDVFTFSDAWLRLRDLADEGVVYQRGMVVGPLRCENDALWLRERGGVVVHVRRGDALAERMLTFKADVVLAHGDCLDEFCKKLDDMVVAMVNVEGAV